MSSANDTQTLEDLVSKLAADPVTAGKDKREWERQFYARPERNIKLGVCRIVMLCSPAPNNVFACRATRNLMQLMSFGELGGNDDLVLMDLREVSHALASKIIWRRYVNLPPIPLVAQSAKDTSAGIEDMKERKADLSADDAALLDRLLAALADENVIATAGTHGHDLKWQDTRKWLYVRLRIGGQRVEDCPTPGSRKRRTTRDHFGSRRRSRQHSPSGPRPTRLSLCCQHHVARR